MIKGKDMFKNIDAVYGMNLPGMKEARLVKVLKNHNNKWTMYYIKDIETGIISCDFTLDKCKTGLSELLLR
jgi:hypothetical protein